MTAIHRKRIVLDVCEQVIASLDCDSKVYENISNDLKLPQLKEEYMERVRIVQDIKKLVEHYAVG